MPAGIISGKIKYSHHCLIQVNAQSNHCLLRHLHSDDTCTVQRLTLSSQLGCCGLGFVCRRCYREACAGRIRYCTAVTSRSAVTVSVAAVDSLNAIPVSCSPISLHQENGDTGTVVSQRKVR